MCSVYDGVAVDCRGNDEEVDADDEEFDVEADGEEALRSGPRGVTVCKAKTCVCVSVCVCMCICIYMMLHDNGY